MARPACTSWPVAFYSLGSAKVSGLQEKKHISNKNPLESAGGFLGFGGSWRAPRRAVAALGPTAGRPTLFCGGRRCRSGEALDPNLDVGSTNACVGGERRARADGRAPLVVRRRARLRGRPVLAIPLPPPCMLSRRLP